jgi:hypothetical protein
MNERIRELAKQAKEETDTLWAKLTPQEFKDTYNQKFAELIVRECLKIVEPTEDSGDEWCVTLKGTAQEIREHFGVEE